MAGSDDFAWYGGQAPAPAGGPVGAVGINHDDALAVDPEGSAPPSRRTGGEPTAFGPPPAPPPAGPLPSRRIRMRRH